MRPKRSWKAIIRCGNREDRLERLKAIRLWYDEDWIKMDPKLRTSVVEGISGFLGLSTCPILPGCSAPRSRLLRPARTPAGKKNAFQIREGMKQHLPPLDELIESGKVLALNFPAGSNPALARAVGVFLKNAWLQTLLLRPAKMQQHPDLYYRPAVFICDEYQSFATVGESDPSGDEKAFCHDAAMPRHSHRRHPVDFLPALRPWRERGLAHPLADSPDPHLPVIERRVQCRDRIESLRPGRTGQGLLDRL